jgi:hypothetical protein
MARCYICHKSNEDYDNTVFVCQECISKYNLKSVDPLYHEDAKKLKIIKQNNYAQLSEQKLAEIGLGAIEKKDYNFACYIACLIYIRDSSSNLYKPLMLKTYNIGGIQLRSDLLLEIQMRLQNKQFHLAKNLFINNIQSYYKESAFHKNIVDMLKEWYNFGLDYILLRYNTDQLVVVKPHKKEIITLRGAIALFLSFLVLVSVGLLVANIIVNSEFSFNNFIYVFAFLVILIVYLKGSKPEKLKKEVEEYFMKILSSNATSYDLLQFNKSDAYTIHTFLLLFRDHKIKNYQLNLLTFRIEKIYL